MDYDGALGGLGGADAKCDARASEAGLSGTFKAWLSDSGCGPADGCRDFTQSTLPYFRVDGVRVADDWADLTDGSLQASINVDEFGDDQDIADAWTNTQIDGSIDVMDSASNCNEWMEGVTIRGTARQWPQ